MELSMLKDKSIGLALGGGAVLGAAHIGVLKALEERNVKIDYIAGTSIGSMVASLYAFGVSVKQIEKIAIDFTWFDITNLSLSKYGLLSNAKMEKLILDHIQDNHIENSKIPLAMVATDISNGDKVILDKGDVVKSIMASSCIPGIFIPVELKDRMLVDGAIAENVPIETVKKMGADFVIAVDLNPVSSNKKPNHIIDVMLNSLHFSIRNIVGQQIKDSDLIIQPNLSDYSLSSTKNIKNLIREGYQAASLVLDSQNP